MGSYRAEGLLIAVTYMGALVGAGFASGQEIWFFFLSYGFAGLWGIICSGVLITVLGIVLLRLGYEGGYSSYQQLFEHFLGPGPAFFLIW